MEETNTNELAAAGQVGEDTKGNKDFSVLDLLRVPAFVVGSDQRVVYANDSFAELVGRSRGRCYNFG